MSKLKSLEWLYAGRHFDPDVIVLYVRRYPHDKLSLRNPVKMMAEKGLSRAHTTFMRWMKRFAPEFGEALESLCHTGGAIRRVGDT